MVLRSWDKLPEDMKVPDVRAYYDILSRKKISIFLKRIFDIVLSVIMLIAVAIPAAIISILIAADSRGGVFYRQERVTTYGRRFKIHKFRTMVSGADRLGSLVTVSSDSRITRIGAFLRKYRLDELPQLIDVFEGNMSFVGTRPEVPKYVDKYTDEMKATLLLPAGITSIASIEYKDEARLLTNAEDADRIYIEEVLPQKMKYNLESIKKFSFFSDIAIMIKTVLAVIKG